MLTQESQSNISPQDSVPQHIHKKKDWQTFRFQTIYSISPSILRRPQKTQHNKLQKTQQQLGPTNKKSG